MLLVRAVRYWQTNFSLFARISTGFALIVAFTLVMALVTLMQVQTLSASFDQLDKVQTRASTTNAIQLATASEVAETLDQLWSGRATIQTSNAADKVQASFQQLRTVESDSAALAKITKLEGQAKELSNYLKQVLELDTKGQAFEARANWVKGSVLFQDLNQGLTELEKLQEATLQTTTRQAADTRTNAIVVIIICTALALLAAIGLAWLVTNSIVRRVKQVSTRMQQIAEDTNLEKVELDITGRDEVAVMAQAFNRMIAKLGSALLALQNTGQTVKASSQYFSEMMQRQLSGAEQEVSAVSSIVSAATQLKEAAYQIDERVEKMSGQARDNLVNINSLTDAVVAASEQVNKTEVATQIVTTGINRMLSETSLVNREVEELVEQLSSIQRLGESLKEIATQTHLLALNAAIESASAGPFGERFSVVAGAVKELADQSQKLVGNMGFFITQIETKANNVTNAITQTDQELAHSQQFIGAIEKIGQENIELSNRMTGAIEKISELVEETFSQAQSIAQATSEQRYATEAIISTINMVDVVVKDNLQQHHTSVTAINNLQSEVERLNSITSNLHSTNAAHADGRVELASAA